jgi:hypothetical protein
MSGGATAVRVVALRAVVVAGVEVVLVVDALTVGRAVVVVAVLLTGTASTSLAFPFPATAVVARLFVALACGSGSDTLKIRSISLARVSPSFPASTSTFFALVAVALAAVLVVRGVATSSGLDAERVARRVGISIAPMSLCLRCPSIEWRNEKKSRPSASHVYMTWHIMVSVPGLSDKG